MGAALEERPRVLLVDDRMARIEFLQNVLFHQGFEVLSVSDDELHAELARRVPAIIVSYLRIDLDRVSDYGVPVLMVVDDATGEHTPSEVTEPSIVYLPRSVGSDVLAAKIASLVAPRQPDDPAVEPGATGGPSETGSVTASEVSQDPERR